MAKNIWLENTFSSRYEKKSAAKITTTTTTVAAAAATATAYKQMPQVITCRYSVTWNSSLAKTKILCTTMRILEAIETLCHTIRRNSLLSVRIEIDALSCRLCASLNIQDTQHTIYKHQ